MSNNYSDLPSFNRDDPVAANHYAERLLTMRQTLAPPRARKRDDNLPLAT